MNGLDLSYVGYGKKKGKYTLYVVRIIWYVFMIELQIKYVNWADYHL